ncbi:MAG TPA: DUF4118 domain-containing protein [Ktedonobacteraceae bacterium]|nr:DUF4118 domain-containing protein [Ktedonobacteraceae bacterium]
MLAVEHIPSLEGPQPLNVRRLLFESVIASACSLAMTGLIYAFQLYPKIPNISIIYLLVVLALAVTFGRYAAVLASVVASLAFDFFLVPPLYTFTIFSVQEWIALGIFLVTALLTSQLAEILRVRTVLAQRREREATILYQLINLVNSHEQLIDQLEVVVASAVRVFGSWGVRACALLLPDKPDSFTQLVYPSSEREPFTLSQNERLLAVSVMSQGRLMEMRNAPSPDSQDEQNKIVHYTRLGAVETLRFIPLKANNRVLGVLCLRVEHPASWFTSEACARDELARSDSRISFFWTFLELAASILERGRLRSYAPAGDVSR